MNIVKIFNKTKSSFYISKKTNDANCVYVVRPGKNKNVCALSWDFTYENDSSVRRHVKEGLLIVDRNVDDKMPENKEELVKEIKLETQSKTFDQESVKSALSMIDSCDDLMRLLEWSQVGHTSRKVMDELSVKIELLKEGSKG